MDFLNHKREGGMVFCNLFLLSPLQCTVIELWKYARGCVCVKKQKSQGKAVEETVNSRRNNTIFRDTLFRDTLSCHPHHHPTSTAWPESECMNVQFRLRFMGIIRIQCLHYKPFSTHFCLRGVGGGGGGVKFVSIGEFELQEGKLLTQLRPRFRPLCSNG